MPTPTLLESIVGATTAASATAGVRGNGFVPPGVVLPFAGSAAPTGWLLCYGQAISRTSYADLFAAIGTTYGVGDGSTTFNLPDLRGRVPAGKDDMGGTAASRLNVTQTGTRASTSSGVITGLSDTTQLAVGMSASGTGIGANATIQTIDSATQVTLSVNSTSTGSGSIRFGVVDGATLGATGGGHIHKLTAVQMPSHTHTVSNAASNTAGGSYTTASISGSTGQLPTSQSAGSDQAHPNLQPTMILNSIIKT